MAFIKLQSILGLCVLVFMAWIISEGRRKISFKTLLVGIGLQFVFALLLLKIPGSREFFFLLNRVVQALEDATRAGTGFVFGYLGGAPLPFDEKNQGLSYILAFRGLPLVLVVSAISCTDFKKRVLHHNGFRHGHYCRDGYGPIRQYPEQINTGYNGTSIDRVNNKRTGIHNHIQTDNP